MTGWYDGGRCISERQVVLVSAFLTMSFGSSLMSATGIIHVSLLNHFKESVPVTAWTGALFSAFFCLGAPLAGVVINMISCRACIICGAFLNLVGFGVSSLVSNIYVLYLTYGVIAGTGQAFGYTGSFVVVGFYFRKQRSLATGVVVAGFAAGMVVFPFLTQTLVAEYGLQGAFLLLSAVGFQTCVFGAIVAPGRTERALYSEAKRRRQISKTSVCKRLYDDLRILNKMSYLIFCVSIFLWCKSLSIVTMFVTDYYHTTGSSMVEAAFLTSLIGIGSIISRVLVGIAAVDGGVDRKLLYFGSYGVIGVFTLTLPFYGTSYWGKACFSSLFGLYTGGSWTLLSPITVELVGLENLASGFSIEMVAAGLGLLTGPIVGGYLINGGTGFTYVFAYAGMMHFLAFFSGLLMSLFTQQDLDTRTKPEHKPMCISEKVEDVVVLYETQPEQKSFLILPTED
ncbi:monocarboxylate transporter 12-like [Pecten maximus]|uniref:monocarboxylate transporter 12-like n=1 Tax=Pecten maximus TaxID=6579 RepID=UPI00145812FE|nr:monocarboxylate transporter 12-like [Pecten maximus]XP_033760684.1 monocarboxylate transporter 12-like [Pecten maximus]XP_033760685.1 monocarboxylate transporter 12-like [Pecten maximus]XP_033760686.1 monocarboxylate transporter 12-like [Pecten maximus]